MINNDKISSRMSTSIERHRPTISERLRGARLIVAACLVSLLLLLGPLAENVSAIVTQQIGTTIVRTWSETVILPPQQATNETRQRTVELTPKMKVTKVKVKLDIGEVGAEGEVEGEMNAKKVKDITERKHIVKQRIDVHQRIRRILCEETLFGCWDWLHADSYYTRVIKGTPSTFEKWIQEGEATYRWIDPPPSSGPAQLGVMTVGSILDSDPSWLIGSPIILTTGAKIPVVSAEALFDGTPFTAPIRIGADMIGDHIVTWQGTLLDGSSFTFDIPLKVIPSIEFVPVEEVIPVTWDKGDTIDIKIRNNEPFDQSVKVDLVPSSGWEVWPDAIQVLELPAQGETNVSLDVLSSANSSEEQIGHIQAKAKTTSGLFAETTLTLSVIFPVEEMRALDQAIYDFERNEWAQLNAELAELQETRKEDLRQNAALEEEVKRLTSEKEALGGSVWRNLIIGLIAGFLVGGGVAFAIMRRRKGSGVSPSIAT